jgi:UDP-N-acetyl-D-mannosaminuronic acid dehydrogenase
MKKKVCVIGLGYVGLTLSASLLECGFEVSGIEIRKNVLEFLKKKKSHFYEPKIEEVLEKYIQNKRFKFSQKIKKKHISDVYIITVGTPLDRNKKSIKDLIINATKEVFSVLKHNDLVILRSTVKIGTSRNIVAKILNKKKQKYKLVFAPERTQEGKALIEIRNIPQIIGGFDKSSSKEAALFFKNLTKDIIIVDSLESAEMIKLVSNTYRDVQFALANEVASLCDYLNLDSNEIIKAGNFKYNRTNLALPGPVAGPCLTKDTYILKESFETKNIFPNIIFSSRKTNEKVPERIIDFIKSDRNLKKINNDKIKIGILGLAFKGNPPTNDIRDSISVHFIKCLKKFYSKSKIIGFDKMITNKDIQKLDIKVTRNIKDIFYKSDLVMILNNHLLFRKINLKNLSKLMNKSGYIYDCWNMLKVTRSELSNNVLYISMGRHYLSKL